MKIENYNPLQGTEGKADLANVLNELEENCRNCHPLTPLSCIDSCRTWRLKHEFRKLDEKMKNPSFTRKLLNALKNERRLQVVEVLAKGRCTLSALQNELKKLGFCHSQQTILGEYVNPMIEVGLIEEDRNQYCITLFGCRIGELMKDYHNIEELLPSHSECYEEMVLSSLLNTSKIYEDFENMIPAKSVARVLNRLQSVGLIETTKDNDYVFYFRSKRDPDKEKLSVTGKRVYENIPSEGISAGKLAVKTGISLRRTYKYLRRLRGKKLVFTRKKPKSYALTAQGVQVALLFKRILELSAEKIVLTVANGKENRELLIPSVSLTGNNEREGKDTVPLAKS